jgi:dethiobiotin synthetase
VPLSITTPLLELHQRSINAIIARLSLGEKMLRPLEPIKLFVTGTGTDIGKTVVSAILTYGLQANYWKPIQSGLSEPPECATDSLWVRNKLNLEAHRIIPESYLFSLPASPHLAANREGKTISTAKIIDQFEALQSFSSLIIEGAGGVMVPLNERELMIDLMACLQVPVIIVASTKLGTINHTLLTVEALRSRNIKIAGIVMNGEGNQSNREAIEKFSAIPVIAEVPELQSTDTISLQNTFSQCFSDLEKDLRSK